MNEVMVVNETTAWEYINKWENENEEATELDVLVWLRKKGLPQEVIMEFMKVYKKVKVIGNRTVQIGKLIIAKIIEFVEEHPKMVVGFVVGAAIGAFLHLIPFIGSMLAPLAIIVGAMIGAEIDYNTDGPIKGLILLACDVFKFFTEVINMICRTETNVNC